MNLNATLFAQFVVFIILAIFTAKVVWPPLVKVLDERAKKIQEGLTAADRSKQEMIAVQNMSRPNLPKQGKKVKNVFRKLKLAHRKLRMTLNKMPKAKPQRLSLRPEKPRQTCRSSRQEKNFVQKSLPLAVKGAEQILKREIDAKAHADLLNKISAEL